MIRSNEFAIYIVLHSLKDKFRHRRRQPYLLSHQEWPFLKEKLINLCSQPTVVVILAKNNHREYWTKSWRANIAIFPMPSAQQELVVVATWLLDRQRCHPIISGMGQALIIDSPFPCIIKKNWYSGMQRGTWILIIQGLEKYIQKRNPITLIENVYNY